MTATIEFFPVDNGDMTLITLESGRRILVDVNIRKGAEGQEDGDMADVASMLRDRLDRDSDGRYFVDVFLLSHPDADHCRGLERHFHLGKPGEWKENKTLMALSVLMLMRGGRKRGDA
jgi:Cft2 family RNA processing exonuclease